MKPSNQKGEGYINLVLEQEYKQMLKSEFMKALEITANAASAAITRARDDGRIITVAVDNDCLIICKAYAEAHNILPVTRHEHDKLNNVNQFKVEPFYTEKQRCSGPCNSLKPPNDFHKDNARTCGRTSQCKACIKLNSGKNYNGTNFSDSEQDCIKAYNKLDLLWRAA